ncbi:MAG: phosphohydrolase [Verrucomicrobiota bacterium]|nr:phosphohydrolase [Verrucomicrobiota bacterium]
MFIETFSGKVINPSNPNVDFIDIEDIAHSLSLQCRFNGHCRTFYSVAEHSIHTSKYLAQQNYSAKLCMWGLLHDASEAYLADIPRPVKTSLKNYLILEKNLSSLIYKKYTFESPDAKAYKPVDDADNALLMTEAAGLVLSKGKDWGIKAPSTDIKLRYYDWNTAKKEYLKMFYFLSDSISK